MEEKMDNEGGGIFYVMKVICRWWKSNNSLLTNFLYRKK